MFGTDKPIKNINEDKLGRSMFARQLANAIINYNTTDNYAISLQGKWGCGKTSVLNMAIEEIESLSKRLEEKDRIIILQFNPWNFTDTTQLISQFFVMLSNSLKFDSKEQNVKNVGAAIEKYSSALEYAEYIPVVGPYLKLIPKLSSKLGKSMREKSENKLNDVAYRKSEVEKALKDLDSRILVVIDDIDRLPNKQIRLIFQLVSSVAGLPNITYLLSYDNEIVARALGEVQNCDGKEYLEKIIQVPFNVPPLDISKVHKVLFEKLDNLIEIHNGLEFDKSHWSNVFNSCISPFIETLRDINRFCNTLSFMYAAVKEEVDFIDMAGICSLNIFATSIYEWIRENKFSLVGGYGGGGVSLNEINKRKEETLQNFKKIYPKNPEIMLNAVASLFPLFSNGISYRSDFTSRSEIHQAMRIASEDRFNLYFALSLDHIKISRKEIDDSLLNMQETELRQYIISLNDRELFDVYLKEVRYNLSRIPKDRIELILSVLVFQSGSLSEENPHLIGADSATISTYTISDMLFRIEDENTRYTIIAKMLSNSDFLSFQFLLHLLHVIELTHGRVAETDYARQNKLVTLEHLYELEKIFIEKTKFFLRTTDLLDWKEALRAFFLWEFIEEETYRDYLAKTLQDNLSVLKYISLKANKWSSSNDEYGYSFSDKSYEEYIDETQVNKTINDLRMTEEFWNLDRKVIETTVAFVLSEQTDEKESVDISLIDSKLEEWKREFEEQSK